MPKTDNVRQVDLPRTTSGGSVSIRGSSGGVSNADTVDGYHASSTPTAGKLLALDAAAHFTPAVIDWSSVAGAGLGASGNTLVVLWGASPTTIVPDAAAGGGSAAMSARSDHTHAIAAAVPGSIQPGDPAGEGTSTAFARSDHRHAIAAAAPTSNLTVTSANAEGNATSFARSNHTHAITNSSNPGAAASILASSASGYLQLIRLGLGVAPSVALQAQGTTPQLRIQSDNSNYATFGADGSGNLTITPSGNSLLLPSGKTLSSANWASQTTGWGIYPESLYGRDGYADFRYIYADELHVKAFIADLEQALAGGQIISKSVAILAADFTVPAKGSTATLTVEDLPGTTAAVFVSGDWIRVRNISRDGGGLVVADCYGTVGSATLNGDGTQSYTFSRPAGDTGSAATSTVVPKGGLALDYGVSGNGFWEVTTLDAAGSPYAQVATWATHPQTLTVRARLGNLDGIAGIGAEWGLWAGKDATHYIKVSDSGAVLSGITQTWLDGSGNTRGVVDPTATGTNALFWLGPSSGDKRMVVQANGVVLFGAVSSASVAGWAHASDLTKIDGGDVYAGTITAVQGTFTTFNLVDNPGFEHPVGGSLAACSGWDMSGGAGRADSSVRSGAYCLVAQGVGSATEVAWTSPRISVEAGTTYYFQGYTYVGAARTVGYQVYQYDATGGYVAVTNYYRLASGWALHEGMFTTASNTAVVNIIAYMGADVTAGTFVRWDDVVLRAASGMNLLVGVPGGARVEINSNGIEGYSDTATRQFYLDATTGRGTFGKGKGILDRTGLILSGSETALDTFNSVRWLNGTLPSGTEIARLSAGRWLDSAPTVELIANDPQDATNASVTVTARGKVFSTHGSSLSLLSWQGSPYGAAAQAQLIAVDDTATCAWTLGQGSIRGMVYTGATGVERMRLQLGSSAAVPTLAIGGDVDTGLWQSAANNLDIATGGTNRVNISSAGMSLSGALTLGGLLTLSQGAPLQCNSSYAITVTHSVHTVRAYTEVLNYLDTISGGTTGSVVFLRGPASGYAVVVRSGTGNIVLDGAASFTLVNYYRTTLALMKWGTTWYELFRMDLA